MVVTSNETAYRVALKEARNVGISEAAWKQLRDTYAAHGIVLALGAGVPKGAETPDWLELLKRIADTCVGDGGRGLVEWLHGDGYSLPNIAAGLEGICPDEKFPEIVREALYREFPFYRGTRGKDFAYSDRPAFVTWIEAHNCTMCAVAALCAVRDEGTGKM